MNTIKTALVTGTTSGIGFAITKHLIDLGWRVVGIARGETPKEFLYLPSSTYFHAKCDIRDYKEVARACSGAAFLSPVDKIDLVVNNAGVYHTEPFEGSQTSVIDLIVDTNIKGTMNVTHAVLEHMGDGSRMIFINSVAGFRPIPYEAVYSASKHALTAFANCIAQENPRIRVTSIHPGGVNTKIAQDNRPEDAEGFMVPEDIVKLVDMVINMGPSVDVKTIVAFPTNEWH